MAETQGAILQRLRDQITRGTVIVRSPHLAEELDRLQGAGDTYRPQGREPHGHRAMAGALAVESWAAQLFPMLKRLRPRTAARDVGSRAVESFIASLR